jgi:hypothetical protein
MSNTAMRHGREYRQATSVARAGSRSSAPAVPRRALLALVGALALAAGLIVYLADRDPSRAALIPSAAVLSTGPLVGALGQWLPSFVHPLAFSLFTAAARRAWTPPAYGACLAWWAVNVAFEVGQHPVVAAPLAAWLTALPQLGSIPALLAAYFVRGTFDPIDLLAATLGALAAATMLRAVQRGDL